MLRECENCQTTNPASSKFCYNCGNGLVSPEEEKANKKKRWILLGILAGIIAMILLITTSVLLVIINTPNPLNIQAATTATAVPSPSATTIITPTAILLPTSAPITIAPTLPSIMVPATTNPPSATPIPLPPTPAFAILGFAALDGNTPKSTPINTATAGQPVYLYIQVGGQSQDEELTVRFPSNLPDLKNKEKLVTVKKGDTYVILDDFKSGLPAGLYEFTITYKNNPTGQKVNLTITVPPTTVPPTTIPPTTVPPTTIPPTTVPPTTVPPTTIPPTTVPPAVCYVENMGTGNSRLITGLGNNLNSPFGLNVYAGTRIGNNSATNALKLVADTSTAWSREEIRADDKNAYRFVDVAVDEALAKNIKVVGLLLYSAGNARIYTPDWNRFVTNTVTHYKGKISYWQILNEPENPLYYSGTADEYGKLLGQTYELIHKTLDPIDPNVKVISAGVGSFAIPWLQKMVDAGGKYDILAINPYIHVAGSGAPILSPEAAYWSDNVVNYIVAFNNRNGKKPIWATEWGWNSGPGGDDVVGDKQPDYIARSYVHGIAAGLDKMFLYEFSDELNDQRSRYSLVQNWSNPKPSYNVYKNLITRLSGATYQGQFNALSANRQLLFDFNSSPAWGQPYDNGSASSSVRSSTTQAKTGKTSLEIDFSLGQDGFSEMGPSSPVSINGIPTRLGFWLYGNNSGALLRLNIVDSKGTTFAYEVGKVGGLGWHYYQAYLPGEIAFSTAGGGTPIYPIKFKSLQLLHQPDPAERIQNTGKMYLDAFYADTGSNVQMYRFTKDNQTVDVIWSDNGNTSINIPTSSGSNQIQAFDREGKSIPISLNNGLIGVNATDKMIFIQHTAANNCR